MRHVFFLFFSPINNEQREGGGRGALPDFFILFSFRCSADHERDWPPWCEAFGLATNTLNECEKQQ